MVKESSELDLDVHVSRQVEPHERVDGLRRGVDDVDQSLVGAHLEVLAAVLVLVRRTDDAVDVLLRRQRHRTDDRRTSARHRVDDLARRAVDDLVVVGLQPDADLLSRHRFVELSLVAGAAGPESAGAAPGVGSCPTPEVGRVAVATRAGADILRCRSSSGSSRTPAWAGRRHAFLAVRRGAGSRPPRWSAAPGRVEQLVQCARGTRALANPLEADAGARSPAAPRGPGCAPGPRGRWCWYYLMILVTRPAPTVRPPSRMVKPMPSSIAIGWMRSTFMSVLSPGMTISVPSGRVTTPVTSVVRK